LRQRAGRMPLPGGYPLKVDRKINIPLYMQVYRSLLEKIRNGAFKEGALLPSERELSTRLGVDRLTLRRALGMLSNEGLIEKKPGVGSWVRNRPARWINGADGRSIMFILPRSVNRIDRITEPFISTLLFQLQKELAPQGFQLVYETLDRDEILPPLARPGGATGVFFISQMPASLLREAAESGVAAVIVNCSDDRFPSVISDREGGAHEAVRRLIGLGHRRIAFISGIPTYQNSRQSYLGYRRALVEADIDWKTQVTKEGDWTFDGGFLAMKEILEEEDELPTGVFAANDMTALGAVEAIKEAGLEVPADVSVVGFDDVDQGRYSDPGLTTVNMDIPLMAKAAARKLLFTVESGEVHGVRIVVPARLVERGSAGPARGAMAERDLEVEQRFERVDSGRTRPGWREAGEGRRG